MKTRTKFGLIFIVSFILLLFGVFLASNSILLKGIGVVLAFSCCFICIFVGCAYIVNID